VKFGTGERTFGPLSRAKFHVYRGNVSSLWGEKPVFRLRSKNNTGVAALRAGLPVINDDDLRFDDAVLKSSCLFFCGHTV